MPRELIIHHHACNSREAEIAAMAKRLPQLEALASEIMKNWHESDLAGGSRQDIAVEHCVLIETIVTELCGENCSCAGYDDFPQTCYRLAHGAEVSDV